MSWSLLWLGAASAAAPQSPICLPIDGAAATAVGVVWAHGYDADPPECRGLARVLTECRLERARSTGARWQAIGLEVTRDHSLAFAVVGPGEGSQAGAFLAALLDDRLPLSDDAIALCTARAALAADDAEFLYPGDVLTARARQSLFRGTAFASPPHGVASEIAALAPDDVRARLQAPTTLRGAGLGRLSPELIATLRALPWPADEPGAMPLPPGPGDASAGAADLHVEEHPRVDAPFVGIAYFVATPASPALAVAIEVARLRAARRLPLRGSEALARAPLMRWSWFDGDPLVLFCRRAEDPVELLPGQVADAGPAEAAESALADLESLLQDLRDREPDPDELAAARAVLRRALELPTAGDAVPWAGQPATYPARLQALLRQSARGIDPSRLETVAAAEAHAALLQVLDSPKTSRAALLPRVRADRGFRRR